MPITPTVDPLGTTSSSELMRQDISNLMDEVNTLSNSNGINRTVTGSDIYYDQTGIPRIWIGQAPNDGRIGVWISKPGQNVQTLLGG